MDINTAIGEERHFYWIKYDTGWECIVKTVYHDTSRLKFMKVENRNYHHYLKGENL